MLHCGPEGYCGNPQLPQWVTTYEGLGCTILAATPATPCFHCLSALMLPTRVNSPRPASSPWSQQPPTPVLTGGWWPCFNSSALCRHTQTFNINTLAIIQQSNRLPRHCPLISCRSGAARSQCMLQQSCPGSWWLCSCCSKQPSGVQQTRRATHTPPCASQDLP